MSRLKLTVTGLLMAVTLVLTMGAASGGVPALNGLQGATGTPEEATTPAPEITPLAGSALVSSTEPWVTEVRIPVVIENVAADRVPADLSILGSLHFAVRDSAGALHGLDQAHPQVAALPNHSLRFLDPAIAARWTLGFRVPTATASDLTLELRQGTAIVESWKVDGLTNVVGTAGASNVADLSVKLGDTVPWGPDVSATPLALGSLVCGDPAIETVTQVITVTFAVANDGFTEVRWPGYAYSDPASVAQWSDGTAADMSLETYVGDSETLPRVSTSAVRMPAMSSATRAMVFAAPRDGRFSDTGTLPAGVMLHSPSGAFWLDLAGVEATVALSPAFCDLGFFGGPIPFGFSPGAKFDVGGEVAAVDAGKLDAAARMTITEALAGAALHYDSHGQSFAGVSGEDLVERAPRLTFVGHDVGADIVGSPGVIYFATRTDDDDFIYVATLSASGRWFCAGVTPHRAAIAADGYDLAEISDICFPQTLVDEG